MREKIEFYIRIIILATAVTMIVADKGWFWAGLAMAADPWRSMIIKKIKDSPSDNMIYVLIVETMATALIYFKLLMAVVI
jgi:hypothetical protein